MKIVELLLPITLSLIIVGVLWVFNNKIKPDWVGELTTSWKKINLIALISSVLFGLITYFIFDNIESLLRFSAVVSSSLLTYCFVQSAFTDTTVRKVDRRTLWFSSIVLLFVNGGLLLVKENEKMLFLYVVCCIVSSILIFIPGLVGASDGRAFLLATAASLPIIGFHLFTRGWIAFLVAIVLYSVIASSRDYLLKKEYSFKDFMKILFVKVSIPAVPFILGPFIVIIPLSGLTFS